MKNLQKEKELQFSEYYNIPIKPQPLELEQKKKVKPTPNYNKTSVYDLYKPKLKEYDEEAAFERV
jgi:hypothetical protein